MKKASKNKLQIMAEESNPYKVGAPFGPETRGYKIGYVNGYNQRDNEIMKGRISDE